jgi:hypothetical protein
VHSFHILEQEERIKEEQHGLKVAARRKLEHELEILQN